MKFWGLCDASLLYAKVGVDEGKGTLMVLIKIAFHLMHFWTQPIS